MLEFIAEGEPDCRAVLLSYGIIMSSIFITIKGQRFTFPKYSPTDFSATPCGRVIAVYNVLGSLEGPSPRFIQAEIMTLKQVFPYLYVFPGDDAQDKLTTQNFILVAAKKPLTSITNEDEQLNRMLTPSLIPEELTYHAPVFTDDYFPANSLLDAY